MVFLQCVGPWTPLQKLGSAAFVSHQMVPRPEMLLSSHADSDTHGLAALHASSLHVFRARLHSFLQNFLALLFFLHGSLHSLNLSSQSSLQTSKSTFWHGGDESDGDGGLNDGGGRSGGDGGGGEGDGGGSEGGSGDGGGGDGGGGEGGGGEGGGGDGGGEGGGGEGGGGEGGGDGGGGDGGGGEGGG